MTEQVKQNPREKAEAQTLGSSEHRSRGAQWGAVQGPEPGVGSKKVRVV